MKINKSKITEKLLKLDIEGGSISTKFIKRKDGKITGELFVMSFFLMILSGGTTLLNWTLQFCKLVDGLTLSEQGLERKLEFRQENFAKWLLSQALRSELNKELRVDTAGELAKVPLDLKRFNQVLVQSR